ncbi:diguanylate cyclase [bacterium]|nr:diguanylate cyclase [bacterium]
MKCPKCNSQMDVKSMDGIEIDLCHTCAGIFLDDGEFQSFTGVDLATRTICFSRFIKVLSKLNQRAIIDDLTGVYTRKHYTEFINNIFENKQRAALTFISIDIDHFKSVNDTYGHDSGDIVLREVAQRLKSALRVSRDEYIFRVGGEEFLVVLLNINHEDSYNAAETLRKIVGTIPIILSDGTTLDTTISLGVALARSNDTPEMLYKRVDEFLYAAKQAGRNQVIVEAS